jgi:basic membrane lipoprotein Med (substrate-binding protein (PBP1-ABC) superfamily)
VALDRSAVAIRRAAARNARHVQAGRLELVHSDLAGYDGAAASFDVAFAVDVNVFWTAPRGTEAARLARLLRASGQVTIVYGAGPTAAPARDVATVVSGALAAAGFATEVRRHPDGMLCVAGHRSG